MTNPTFSLLLLLVLSAPRGSSAAETADSPPAALGSASLVTQLEYQELDAGIQRWSLDVERLPGPFLKEPAWAEIGVSRGLLRFGNQTNHYLAFAWNHAQGQLHLDLNRNRDLTDDPEGVFSSPRPRYAFAAQTFTNVGLSFQAPTGPHRFLANLELRNPNAPYGFIELRSFWQGKIELQGREWQLGLIENPVGEIGSLKAGYLVLRPWESRDRSLNLNYGASALDGLGFSSQVFIQNQAYELLYSFEPSEPVSRCKVEFKKQEPKLGQLKLPGQFIERLVLEAGPFLVILDQPGPAVQIPVGVYSRYRVRLKQGGVEAYHSLETSRVRPPLELAEDQAAVLALGGPLTNSVAVQRRGRRLVLNYQLVGMEGSSFLLARSGERVPPRFTVYQGDKVLKSGQFEFG